MNTLKNSCAFMLKAMERNIQRIKTYEKGYPQQMIATVLEITQQAVCAVVKRSRE